MRRDRNNLREYKERLIGKVNTLEPEARRPKEGKAPGRTAEGEPEIPRAESVVG